MAQDQDSQKLNNCLKIVENNKSTLNNIWNMSLIDDFRDLIDNHHQALCSFQLVGSMLENSTKLYGMRVDSVHADVLRTSSILTRQKSSDRTMDRTMDRTSDGSHVQVEITEPNQEIEKLQSFRDCRKHITTVVGNKQLIDGKLDTTNPIDTTFMKLKSTIESSNGKQKLLQHILSSEESVLRLRKCYQVWDSKDIEQVSINDENYSNEDIVELAKIDWFPLNTDVIRHSIRGYIISDTPSNNDWTEQIPITYDQCGNVDQSSIDLRFDMYASVEPICDEPCSMLIDENIFDNLLEDDQQAIRSCGALQRCNTFIEEMRPDSMSLNLQLEYSYRLLTGDNRWAGPSYWKFQKQRKTETKRKRRKVVRPIVFKDVVANLYISTSQSAALSTVRNNGWNPKKIKLPQHLNLDVNRFLRYSFALGISLAKNIPSSNSSPRAIDEFNNFGNNLENDIEMTDESMEDVVINGGQSVSVDEQAHQVNSKTTTAKAIDMRELNRCCLQIILEDCSETAGMDLPKRNVTLNEEYLDGSSSFLRVYEKLPSRLSENLKKNLSPAIVFSSILQISNSNQLRLMEEGENNFKIRQIQ